MQTGESVGDPLRFRSPESSRVASKLSLLLVWFI